MDIEETANKARTINHWGSSPANSAKKLDQKNDFSNLLQKNDYTEITDLDLGKTELRFSVRINKHVYKGSSLLNKEYMNIDRIFRKPRLEDFKYVSFSQKDNSGFFKFQLNPPEDQKVNEIFKKVLTLLDNDGDSLQNEVTRPPQSPQSGMPDQERQRARTRRLHFTSLV